MADRPLPALRIAILSSGDSKGSALARSLEQRLTMGLDTSSSPIDGEALAEQFELRVFSTVPPGDAGSWLDQTLHSVIVVFVDEKIVQDAALLDWLRAAAKHLGKEPGRHSLLAVPFSDDLKEQWQAEKETLGRFQSLPWYTLGEEAERADKLALRVLNRMVRVLATAVFNTPDWKLRVFLSHAKLDGLYLAQSVRHFIETQHWLEKFYDAEDIEPGLSWEDQLRQGVSSSIVLVLRTDAYDRRFWCRSEVRWAEFLGVPVVVVDARSGLVYPASDLPFEGAQTVRVPDGNLPRIVFAVLRTALQSMLFQRSVRQLCVLGKLPSRREVVRVLPVVSGISAIVQACDDLRNAPEEPRFVVYPDPPLRDGLLKAAQVLTESVHARLVTPRQIQEETAS
jgi:TIR domain-containing protein